jgi:SAM-dependent methyltransferase
MGEIFPGFRELIGQIMFLKRFALTLIHTVLKPFPTLKTLIIRSIIMAEGERSPEKSLKWLLNIHGFVESWIDRQCISLGKGIHIKHEIMDGIHSFFYERISEGSHVLDIGCGNGVVAYAISTHSRAIVTGIDYNEEHIRLAREYFKNPNLKFLINNASDYFTDEKFDIIVMSSVLEHVQDRPGLIRMLVIRYNPSRILIRVPMFERHYHAALKKRLDIFPYTDADHKIEYTLESFGDEMRISGLEILFSEIRWGDIWAECAPTKTLTLK